MSPHAFSIIAAILAWTGAAILLIALFGGSFVQGIRRFRGTVKKRCPKCWYDLSHTPPQPVARASRPCELTDAQERPHRRDARATMPLITCSECGWRAKRERQLYRGRKRWKLAGFAMVMLIGSYAANVTPGVQERGWVAAVPTTALILALPWIEPDEEDAAVWLHTTSPETLGLRGRLTHELTLHRVKEKRLWSWQAPILAELCVRGERNRTADERAQFDVRDHGLRRGRSRFEIIAGAGFYSGAFGRWSVRRFITLSSIEIETREAWPVAVEPMGLLTVEFWPATAHYRVRLEPRTKGLTSQQRFGSRWGPPLLCGVSPCPWHESRIPLGMPVSETAFFEYEVIYEVCNLRNRPVGGGFMIERYDCVAMHTEPYRLPTRIKGSIEDHLTAVEMPEDARAAMCATRIAVFIGERDCSVVVPSGWRDILASIDFVTFGVQIEILADFVPIARGPVWWRVGGERGDDFGALGTRITLPLLDGVDPRSVRDANVRIRLTGDPAIALRDFGATHYWDGKITVPVDLQGFWWQYEFMGE